MRDAINESAQQQGEAPNALNESDQIVMVIKPKVILNDAVNVLPPAKESNTNGKNETITIDNTVALKDISTEVDAETGEDMNVNYSLLDDDDNR